MKKLLLTLSLIFVWFYPSVVEAQLKKLTSYDKSSIIEAVIKDYDFNNSRRWKNEKENIIYLSTENISSKQFLQRKGVKFVIITPIEALQMEEKGIEYYRFEEFKVKQTLVEILFSRRYVNDASGEIYVRDTKYTLQKRLGKWRIKVRRDSAHAS